MSPTPNQPTLPAEIAFTDAELNFIEESPPGLFPENQNSNFGLFRKIFTDRIQVLIGQLTTIYNEQFPSTSTQFLDVWEAQVGLPVAPTSITDAQRRANILGRLAKASFTRVRRASIVENFIIATFGSPIQLSPSGVPLSAAGTPLYTESSSLTGLYAIVEDLVNFFYHVRIKNTLSPDLVGMNRELALITPSSISFDIVSVAVP
jgi:hypothetical protein